MEAAKNSVRDFMSKSGHHDTTVHENMAPAVTQETVEKHQHEEVNQAVDREVHQDHYHTTVQPVKDNQKLDTQHHYNVAEVQHRKFEHGDDEEVQRRLQAEQAKFKDTTTKGSTTHTTSEAAAKVGEHVHHHVHETIQPVIQRQTIEPHVIHTTIPIHETHHSAAKHHSATALPAVSLEEFKAKGGHVHGRDARTDFFEGEPKHMAGHKPDSANPSSEFRNTGHVDQHSHGSTATTSTHPSAGITNSAVGTGTHIAGGGSHSGTTHQSGTVSSGMADSSGLGGSSGLPGSNTSKATSGLSSRNATTTSGLDSQRGHMGTDGRIDSVGGAGTTTTKKPSLMDKLNPKIDADGDGKPGFLS